MNDVTLYHNARCSKSRQTLALLQARGVAPRIISYLEQTPTEQELQQLLAKLQMSARELLRSGESAYRELGLDDAGLSEAALLRAMHENPCLIQRPIVLRGDRAVLGRPPENVEQLF